MTGRLRNNLTFSAGLLAWCAVVVAGSSAPAVTTSWNTNSSGNFNAPANWDNGAPDGDDDPESQLYRKAVQVVAESQKASTSYIQRQLRIGYNSAARLIERMEKEGKVGQPDHVGRREVLMDTDGHPI